MTDRNDTGQNPKPAITRCKACGVELVNGKPVNLPRRNGGGIPAWLTAIAVVLFLAYLITPQSKQQEIMGAVGLGGNQQAQGGTSGGPGPVDPNAPLPEGHPPIDGSEGMGGAAGMASGTMPGDVMAQLSELRERVEKDPKDTEALRKLGDMYYDIQRADPAIEYYEKYLAIVPDDAMVHTDCGAMYFQKGDLDKARYHFETAIKFHPELPQPLFNLALVQATEGDNEGARASLEKAKTVTSDPNMLSGIEQMLKSLDEHNH
ncbi:MAG: tetratricopeptide repeat protein [bacterium]|jgi:hypothetical protein